MYEQDYVDCYTHIDQTNGPSQREMYATAFTNYDEGVRNRIPVERLVINLMEDVSAVVSKVRYQQEPDPASTYVCIPTNIAYGEKTHLLRQTYHGVPILNSDSLVTTGGLDNPGYSGPASFGFSYQSPSLIRDSEGHEISSQPTIKKEDIPSLIQPIYNNVDAVDASLFYVRYPSAQVYRGPRINQELKINVIKLSQPYSPEGWRLAWVFNDEDVSYAKTPKNPLDGRTIIDAHHTNNIGDLQQALYFEVNART
jgi:hypothetical protein